MSSELKLQNLFFIFLYKGKMSDGDIEKMIEKADVDNDG